MEHFPVVGSPDDEGHRRTLVQNRQQCLNTDKVGDSADDAYL